MSPMGAINTGYSKSQHWTVTRTFVLLSHRGFVTQLFAIELINGLIIQSKSVYV